MSPVGLDVQFHTFAIWEAFIEVDGEGVGGFAEGWMVTKVSAFAPADSPISLNFYTFRNSPSGGLFNKVTIAPGGCYVAHPGGAFRSFVGILGAQPGPPGSNGGVGAQLVVEYWFAARTGTDTPHPGGLLIPTRTVFTGL
jgi:hypothetical protein